MYQLNRLSFGNARSFAPIISAKEVAEDRRNRRDQKEEHHDDAVHGEQLVVHIVAHEIAGGRREIQADEHGERAADEEEHRNGGEVEQRDALVVARQQPRLDAIAVVQIMVG